MRDVKQKLFLGDFVKDGTSKFHMYLTTYFIIIFVEIQMQNEKEYGATLLILEWNGNIVIQKVILLFNNYKERNKCFSYLCLYPRREIF